MDLNHMVAHENIVLNNKGEREYHLATATNRQSTSKLLTKHHGGSTVDEDGSGGTSPSRQGTGTEASIPRIRVFNLGNARACFWKFLWGFLGF